MSFGENRSGGFGYFSTSLNMLLVVKITHSEKKKMFEHKVLPQFLIKYYSITLAVHCENNYGFLKQELL